MRPSQYNYIKRTFTRSMANINSFSIWNILLFPFRICLIITVCIMYAGILVLFYATKIVFKIIFNFIKFLFKYLWLGFIGFIFFSKKYINNEIKLFKKYKKEAEYENFLNKSEEINIPDMMQEFNISSSQAIEIASDIKTKNNLSISKEKL